MQFQNVLSFCLWILKLWGKNKKCPIQPHPPLLRILIKVLPVFHICDLNPIEDQWPRYLIFTSKKYFCRERSSMYIQLSSLHCTNLALFRGGLLTKLNVRYFKPVHSSKVHVIVLSVFSKRVEITRRRPTAITYVSFGSFLNSNHRLFWGL